MSVSRMTGLRGDIADKVATALAQTYGVIFRADASRQVDWSTYACTLSDDVYRVRLDTAAHLAVRACQKVAVARFPTCASA